METTIQLRKRIIELEAALADAEESQQILGQELFNARAALEGIANSPHCSYENNPGEYGTGVADGHRCAANMARKALP